MIDFLVPAERDKQQGCYEWNTLGVQGHISMAAEMRLRFLCTFHSSVMSLFIDYSTYAAAAGFWPYMTCKLQ